MVPHIRAIVEGGAISGRGSVFHTEKVVKSSLNSGGRTLLPPAAGRYARLLVKAPPISTRAAIAFAVAAVTLEFVASSMYSAATGFSAGLSVDPSKLLASGPGGASLIRWGSVIDMLGYLSIAPVVVYLRARYSAAPNVDLFAAAGLAVVVIGSIGAASMATAAPPLIHEYAAASGAQKQLVLPAFATLYRAVVVGMWQTLETIPATVWLLGTASAARREGPRSVFLILVVLGVINGAIALYRLTAG
jgi:hypothetical protein